MKKGFIYIAPLLIMILFVFPAHGKTKGMTVPYLETRIDRDHTVEGERLIYEVILVSPDAAVAGAEVMANPEFPGLDISRSAPDNHLEEVNIDGRLYYRAVIDRFFIGTNNKGKYTIKGGDYRIGLNRQITINDPYWGPSLANRVEMFALSAPDLKIKVDALPVSNRPENFSGAVGKFDVEMTLIDQPRAGDDIRMMVTIVGLGDLSEAILPDLPKYFPEGLHFKSMTDARSHFIKNGSIGSEIEIECLFTAGKAGKYTISPIEFSYFDSDKGKYVTAKSDPLEFEVTESKHYDETPPVIMDV